MGSIKTLIILPMAALHLPVMPGCKRANDFMPYAMCFQMFLEKGGLIPVGGKAVGELTAVVRLNAFNFAGKGFYQVIHK